MGKGFLILCFDDGYIDTYTAAYPMLKKYGLVAVVGVITGLVGNVHHSISYPFEEYRLASLNQLQEMREDRWEMASHSVNHSPLLWNIGRIDDFEHLDAALKDSRDWIIHNRLGDGRTFIYPYGATPVGIIELVKKYYWFGRSIDDPPVYYDLPLNSDQRYRLWSYSVEHPLSKKRLLEIRERVQYARNNSAIIPLAFHRITSNPRRIFDIKLRELKAILDIIIKEDMETVTFGDVIDKVWGVES